MCECKVEWCNKKPNRSGKGYCRLHYDQIRKYGHITNYRPAGQRNEYVIKQDYAELHILNENGDIKEIVLIDKEDIELLKQYSFRTHNKGYISTVSNGKTIYLHQILLNSQGLKDLEVDHINRNKLDNRRDNLRLCRHIDNTHNRKRHNKYGQQGIKKVNRNLTKTYLASIVDNGRYVYLGYYETPEKATEARIKAEKELYKEFATI